MSDSWKEERRPVARGSQFQPPSGVPFLRRVHPLIELDQPPVGALPFLVGVDGVVVQAVQESSNARAVHRSLLDRLADEVATREPPDRRLVRLEQPLDGRRSHGVIIAPRSRHEHA
jgi:hypothetical protein